MTLVIILLLVYLLAAFLSNAGLMVTTYRIPAPREALKGLRIVQLSDLHGRSFRPGGRRLLARLKAIEPDLVVITGDLVSKHQRSWRGSVVAAVAMAARYPVYYIPGNHEVVRRDLPRIADALRAGGVTVLQDQTVHWAGRGAQVAIIGLADFVSRHGRARYESTIKSLVAAAGDVPLKILLSHRPQLARLYSQSGCDIVFSGHAHGGQVNLPGLGPLYSPDEGLWPRYAAGVHRLDRSGTADRSTTLVISRGLGGLWFVPRICNPPEIVVIDLN